MALDKQKILNELGSVVNQLQGANCGCMGKIFSNCTHQNDHSGNPPSHGGGCGSCGHHCHGYQNQQGWGMNAPCGGEPHSNQPCTNQCNPRMLYADTYKYLNQNLMQPTLKEVYDDLKSITPANTIANTPMANRLGLRNPLQNMSEGEMSNAMAFNQMAGGGMSNTPNNQMSSGMNNMPLNQMNGGRMSHNMPQNQMTVGGMSHNMPQNQMNSGGMNNMPQNQMNSDGMNNMPQNQMNSGGMNNMPQNQMNSGGMNNMPQNQMNSGGINNMPQNQISGGGMSDMIPQNQIYGTSGGNMYGNAQVNAVANNMSQNMNPTQKMASMSASPTNQQKAPHNQAKHGQGAGIFNSMFPGVMQGLGGDLDFDPMSIAIQMNPSNQQRSAMDSMNKMMMGNKEGINRMLTETGDSAAMQPAVKGVNAAAADLNHSQPSQMHQNVLAYQAVPMQQNAPIGHQPAHMQQNALTSYQPTQMQQNTPTAYQPTQMQENAPTGYEPAQMEQNAPIGYQSAQIKQRAPVPYQPTQMQQNTPTAYQQMTPTHDLGPTYQQSQQQLSATMAEVPPQQVYTAHTGAPTMYQQEIPKDMQQVRYQQMDPNTGATATYGGSGDPNAHPVQYNQQQYKEPIFPAVPSRQPYYSAQQVKHMPKSTYQAPEQQTNLMQQAPTRMNAPMAFSNVKSTISKTSLMGFKRSGKVPSRSQLQHIYNQYKGSHSYTQQNVKPSERTTHSAGNLNPTDAQPAAVPAPVERVGGDTINNQLNIQNVNKVDHVIGRMGDVPANNKPLENIPKETLPTKHSRCRNGLQDVVFTSYPSSAAWSFHGNRFRE